MRTALLVGIALVFVSVQPSWAADKPEDVATRSAQVFLSLVDQGKLGESWDSAAKLFQAALSRDKWQQAVGAARTPFGKLLSRQVKSAEYRTSLPGAPDGKYVIVQFAASFENKKEAVETVTPMQEADGSWRVSGYFIR